MPTRVVFALLALCVLGYSYTVDFYYCDYRGGTTFCNNFPLFGQGGKFQRLTKLSTKITILTVSLLLMSTQDLILSL